MKYIRCGRELEKKIDTARLKHAFAIVRKMIHKFHYENNGITLKMRPCPLINRVASTVCPDATRIH